MMFDNSPPPPTPRWTIIKEHLPLAVLIVAGVAVAAGIHMASATLAVAAAAHLAVAGIIFVVRGRRNGPTQGASL